MTSIVAIAAETQRRWNKILRTRKSNPFTKLLNDKTSMIFEKIMGMTKNNIQQRTKDIMRLINEGNEIARAIGRMK